MDCPSPRSFLAGRGRTRRTCLRAASTPVFPLENIRHRTGGELSDCPVVRKVGASYPQTVLEKDSTKIRQRKPESRTSQIYESRNFNKPSSQRNPFTARDVFVAPPGRGCGHKPAAAGLTAAHLVTWSQRAGGG